MLTSTRLHGIDHEATLNKLLGLWKNPGFSAYVGIYMMYLKVFPQCSEVLISEVKLSLIRKPHQIKRVFSEAAGYTMCILEPSTTEGHKCLFRIV